MKRRHGRWELFSGRHVKYGGSLLMLVLASLCMVGSGFSSFLLGSGSASAGPADVDVAPVYDSGDYLMNNSHSMSDYDTNNGFVGDYDAFCRDGYMNVVLRERNGFSLANLASSVGSTSLSMNVSVSSTLDSYFTSTSFKVVEHRTGSTATTSSDFGTAKSGVHTISADTVSNAAYTTFSIEYAFTVSSSTDWATFAALIPSSTFTVSFLLGGVS